PCAWPAKYCACIPQGVKLMRITTSSAAWAVVAKRLAEPTTAATAAATKLSFKDICSPPGLGSGFGKDGQATLFACDTVEASGNRVKTFEHHSPLRYSRIILQYDRIILAKETIDVDACQTIF